MKKRMMVILLMTVVVVSLSFASFERFRVDFPQCTLVYVPSSQVLQISASGRVLSFGQGWTVQQVRPFLYHLRLNTWSGFYWMVNSSRKEAYRVTGGTFGSVGGNQSRLNIQVDVVGGAGESVPTRFSLQFTDAYLIYVRATREIQISATGSVLSYGQDWQKAEVHSYLIHIKHNNWSGFYWKVNTSRREIYNVQGGTFGAISPGSETVLNFPVTVVGQLQPQTYTLALSAMAGGSVTGGGQYAVGTVVNIQATPNPGHQFANWRRGTIIVSNQASYAYTMPAENVTLNAYFTPSPLPQGHTLTLQSNPIAGGTVTGGGSYLAGFTANIQAVPNPGYQFVHWRRGSIIVSNQANYAYQMPSESVSLTAIFSSSAPPPPMTFTLDLQMNPPMGGFVSGGGSFAPGTWVNIQVSTNPGYQFTGWTRTDSSTGWPGVPYSNQASFGFSMPAQNLTLVANFNQQTVPGQPRLGIYVEDHPFGVIVTNVSSGFPAFGRIQVGDMLTHIQFLPHGSVAAHGLGMVSIGMNIISVNAPSGSPIQNTMQLQSMIASVPPGNAVAIWIRRGGVYRLFVVLNLGTAFPTAYLF